jgi:hypothetical protein
MTLSKHRYIFLELLSNKKKASIFDSAPKQPRAHQFVFD